MLTLLGTILGLFGSLLPEILKFFTQKEDHRHEVEMARLQMEAAKQAGEIKLEEINATADIEEAKAIYASAEQKITGVRWIDGLVALYSSSVRPTLTYGFFVLYAYVKYSMIYTAIQAGANWQSLGGQIWGSDDFAVFSTICAFWFGGRFLKSALARTNGNGNGKK
jgi:hypothetical protein